MKEVEEQIVEEKKSGVETEPFDLEAPGIDAYFGTKKQREDIGKQMLRGYDAQKTMIDKALFFIYNEMKNSVTVADIDPNYPGATIHVNKNLPEEEKQRLVADAQKSFDEALLKREALGISKTTNTSPEDEKASEDLAKKFFKDFVGDGSRKTIVENYKQFQLINSYIEYITGIEYKKNLDELKKKDPNDPLNEKKAAYLTSYRKSTMVNLLGSAKSGADSQIAMYLIPDAQDPAGIGEQMFKNLKFNNQMKLSAYLKSMGLTEYEKKLYLSRNGWKEDDNVYEVFSRSVEEKGIEVTRNNVLAEIKKDYAETYGTSILDELVGTPASFFDQNFDQTLMDMEDLATLLKYNEAEKAALFKELNAKPNDIAFGKFVNKLNSDEEFKEKLKQRKLAKGMSPEEAVLITGDDYKQYLKDFITDETNRFLFDEYPSRDKVTIEKYLATIGYDKDEIKAYTTGKNVPPEVPAMTVMKMEYMKTLGPAEAQNFNTMSVAEADKLVAKFAADFMNKERNRLKAEGRKKVYLNKGFEMREEFNDSLELESEKEIHNLGVKMLANEGVSPKTNPTKPEDIAYKEWADTVADPMFKEKYYTDIVQSYGVVRSKVMSGQELGIMKEKVVERFFDVNVSNIDITLLKGIRVALEATKGGYGTGHKDSEKFNEMLDALKKFENKLATNETEGLNDAREKLILKCKNYVSNREDVRKADYGNDRFDAASTVLYSILPKDEFARWATAVNGKRKSDKITWARCQEKQSAYLIAQQNREIKAQSIAAESRLSKPMEYAKRMSRVEKFYGKRPTFDDKFEGVFSREEFAEKFKAIGEKEDFVTIGASPAGGNLSDQDFSALVFAGTVTPEVAAEDRRYREFFEDKILLTGKDYTTELAKNPVPEECSKHLDVIAGGRNAAINAMNEYAAGNKHPLAHILAAGIRFAAAGGRAMDKMNEDIFMHSEMGARMLGMLERDDELKKYTEKNYVGAFKDDVNQIKSMTAMSDIYLKSENARKFINKVKDDPEKARSLDRQTKEKLMTDILVKRLVEDCSKQYRLTREKNPSYTNKIKLYQKNYNIAQTELVKKGFGDENHPALSAEEYAAEQKKIDDKLNLQTIVAKDANRYNPVVQSLSNSKSVDELRESVKKVVKDSGMGKLSIKEIIKEFNSDNIVKKVANMSQNTRADIAEKNRKAAEAARKKAVKKNPQNPAL